MHHELDELWIEAASKLGIAVQRGGDAYVHFDGWVLHIAEPAELDADDSLAQLILHELCHFAVEGPAARHVPDWGLDNTVDDGDGHVREAAAVRLHAHWCGRYGLRDVLYPTTAVRALFEALPDDVFTPPDEPSVVLARAAALRAAEPPFGPVLRHALDQTRMRLGRTLHRKSGYPLRGDVCCGACVWRTAAGSCRMAGGRRLVASTEPGCTGFNAALDCLGCGACCRSAYDVVEVSRREPVVRRHPALMVVREGRYTLLRDGDHCAALGDAQKGVLVCRIYEDRPRTCREFEPGGRHCLSARRKVGLSG